MSTPYPLQFQPEFKERVWGGRALEHFGLTLPEGHIGEGWMIADHANGTTKVLNGPLAGKVWMRSANSSVRLGLERRVFLKKEDASLC